MSHKLYVEAVSPMDIHQHFPPSHQQAIQDIAHLPDDQYAAYISDAGSILLSSWVRVKQGLYHNDIAYVLCEDDTSLDVLIVPRECLYDEIDGEDIPGVIAGKQREWKLFDPLIAKDAGYEVHPFRCQDSIFRCKNSYYHHGLLRCSFAKSSLESITAPHPDQITLHVEAQVDPDLIKRSHLLFSALFWKEGDQVRFQVGDFIGERVTILSVNVEQGSIQVTLADSHVVPAAYDVPVLDVRQEFHHGDDVKVLAGAYRGSVDMVLSSAEDLVTFLLQKDLNIVSSIWF
jgi:ribosomal protein L24